MKVLVIQLEQDKGMHPGTLLDIAERYRKSIDEYGVLILPKDVTYEVVELDWKETMKLQPGGIVFVNAEKSK